MQVFPLRDGKMIDRYGFHLENVVEGDAQSVLEAFVVEFYGSAPSVPRRCSCRPGVEISRRSRRSSRSGAARASRCEPRARREARLVELAVENARLALEADTVQREQQRLRRVAALEDLRECLNLESLPVRIECFDVSNIQG